MRASSTASLAISGRAKWLASHGATVDLPLAGGPLTTMYHRWRSTTIMPPWPSDARGGVVPSATPQQTTDSGSANETPPDGEHRVVRCCLSPVMQTSGHPSVKPVDRIRPSVWAVEGDPCPLGERFEHFVDLEPGTTAVVHAVSGEEHLDVVV
jgi:hypothetical protein